jgi:hypothetical protein
MPTTPAEALLHRIRRQCRLDGFRVSLSERRGDLYLYPGTKQLPDPATVVAFMVVLTGDAVDLVRIHIGRELAQTHQLVNNRRTWRTSTVEPAEEAA